MLTLLFLAASAIIVWLIYIIDYPPVGFVLMLVAGYFFYSAVGLVLHSPPLPLRALLGLFLGMA
jgi:hypothetical protein